MDSQATKFYFLSSNFPGRITCNNKLNSISRNSVLTHYKMHIHSLLRSLCSKSFIENTEILDIPFDKHTKKAFDYFYGNVDIHEIDIELLYGFF